MQSGVFGEALLPLRELPIVPPDPQGPSRGPVGAGGYLMRLGLAGVGRQLAGQLGRRGLQLLLSRNRGPIRQFM